MLKSVVQTDPVLGEIEFIDSLELAENLSTGLRMFRAAEHSQVIVVHADVREACLAAGISGVSRVAVGESRRFDATIDRTRSLRSASDVPLRGVRQSAP